MILPTAGRSFEWRNTRFGPALVCTALEPIAPHLFTTRHWTLGMSGPSESAWWEVSEAMGVAPDSLARVTQVHGATVVAADDAHPGSAGQRPEADVVVAVAPGRVVAVQAADCVPLLLADPRSGAVVAAHSGWRGMVAGVAAAGVAALERAVDATPDHLVAVIGPSVGACCYEVGSDVREAFVRSGASGEQLARWFRDAPVAMANNPPMPGLSTTLRPGHWYLDGWAVVHEQLVAAGLRAGRVFSAGLCTASHPSSLCSYRRDGSAAGRMAAVIRSRGARRTDPT
jgi:polyphenol oxidase